MSTLYLLRGLPGCGKTTKAVAWVDEDPKGRVRISRDSIRQALHGRYIGEPWAEQQVTEVQRGAIVAALEIGYDVVVDDTNLEGWVVSRLKGYAASVPNALVEVWDMRHVDVDVCLARNAARPEPERVPERWIIDAWTEHIQPLEEAALASDAERAAKRMFAAAPSAPLEAGHA